MYKNKVYFNSANNVYSNVPAAIFSGNSARYVGASSQWGRDTGVDAVIANQPLLVSGGNVVFGGDDEVKRAGAGNRSFVGSSGSTAYIGVVYNANAAQKVARSYEHIDPAAVGNRTRVLVSDMAGRSSVVMKARELGFDINEQTPAVKGVLEELKRLEFEGYEFEAADASLKLLLARRLKVHTPAFEFEGFRVIIERRGPESSLVAEATVKVKVNGKSMHTVAECVGPISALDKALRLALERAHPSIKDTALSDYKVRILDSRRGTNSRTRVLIETSDHGEMWGTVGVSDNVIEASWEALCDSFEYKLLREEEKKRAGGKKTGDA